MPLKIKIKITKTECAFKFFACGAKPLKFLPAAQRRGGGGFKNGLGKDKRAK